MMAKGKGMKARNKLMKTKSKGFIPKTIRGKNIEYDMTPQGPNAFSTSTISNKSP